MAYRSLFLASSPILIGAPFTYPFFTNLLTAIFIRAGVPFFAAFTIPSWIIVSTGISLLFLFYKLILKSEKMAVLATLLFLLNGGTGIFWVLRNPAKWTESTHISELGIEWISVINSTFIPQRAFGLGFLVGILALLLIFYSWSKSKSGRIPLKIILISGVLLGSLPLLHMHSFATLAIYFAGLVASILFIYKNESFKKLLQQDLRPWLGIGSVAALIAILILVLAYPELSGDQHLWFKPGWMATENHINWFLFWWRNWGLVPLLAVIGFWLTIKSQRKLTPWFTGFFVIFGFGNLFALQPYLWDNTKLFTWSSVGFSALAIITLAKIWQRHRLGKFVAVAIFCFSIASGAYDLAYTLNFKRHQYQMYSAEELTLTKWVKNNTNRDSIWLTSDKHNHWLYNLTGRQALMGYQGWLWSHGYDFEQIASDVSEMYNNPVTNLELFKKYQVNYVVIGPSEKAIYQPDIAGYRELFKTVRTSENFEIFATDHQP